MLKNFALIVPAYLPGKNFYKLVQGFSELSFYKIIIIDDGCGKNYSTIFKKIRK